MLIDLKREIKEDTVNVMKAKTQVLNVFQKPRLFDQHESVKQSMGRFRPNKYCIQLKIEMN